MVETVSSTSLSMGLCPLFSLYLKMIKHIEYVNSIQQYEVVTVFNEMVTVFNEMVTVFNEVVTVFNAHEPHPAAVALLP